MNSQDDPARPQPDSPVPSINQRERPSSVEHPRPSTPRRSRWALLGLWLAGLVGGGTVMLGGALYGISAYKLFAELFSPGQGASGVMLASFLAGVPLVIGLLVGALARRYKLAGAASVSMWSILAIGLFVFAAGAMFREGTICILMALPFLFGLVVLGVLIGWVMSLFNKGGPKTLGVALLMPFAFGVAERELESPDALHVVTRSIHIEAQPEVVWQHINFPTDIRPAELQGGLAYRIGVPYPLEARTLQPGVGGRRQLVWQRGVRFEEEITAWRENRYIAWTYHFTPASFPPGSLDDHIVIGGRYFGLEDTAYTLTPESGGTRLDIRFTTRVTTNFNWYAGLWAQFLTDDTAVAILNFYKHRSEAGAG